MASGIVVVLKLFNPIFLPGPWQELGTRLLDAVEREARRRGCDRIVLTTFSFQAPDFYRKHGFVVLAATEDHPHGHQHLLPRKRLE